VHVGERARYWLALFTSLLALAFCVVLFVLATLYWHEAWAKNWRSDTVWRSRLWIPYISIPIGLGLLVLQYVGELVKLVTGRSKPFGIGEETAP
jgi:TRAP-type C4-dicarboxylate transport system permease small subunit